MRKTRAARVRAALTVTVAAVVPVLGLSGCDSGRPAGSALFTDPGWTSIDAKAIRPGAEIGLLYYDILNTSNSALVVDSVGIAGPGIGTVVRPVQVMMAPLRFGWHDYEPESVGGALYTTNPPVLFEGKHCRKQVLVPVKGFTMAPGTDARIWIVLRALRPGRWAIPAHVIYYSTRAGFEFRQVEPWRAYGVVTRDAPYIPPFYAMAECVVQEGASFLPGFHARQVSG